MRATKLFINQLRRAARIAAILVACVGLATAAWAATGSDDAYTEYSVKAAYLLKFGSFVDWPPNAFPNAETPFVIGVLGDDPFGAVLDQIVGTHAVMGRAVTLKRFSRIDDVRGVNVLYISQSERDDLPTIVASLAGKNILTVSEADMPGVVVNFVVDRNRVRFDINLHQAERAGLKISSKLLTVARTVKAS